MRFTYKIIFSVGLLTASIFLYLGARAATDSQSVNIIFSVPSSSTSTPYCGDGIKNTPSEECDGNDLGVSTCATEGYSCGTLACSVCHLVTTGCRNTDCGGQSDTTNPEILAIAATSSYNDVTIGWTATDNSAIGQCGLSYGTDTNYASSSFYNLVGTGADLKNLSFSQSITNLTSSTIYYFRISCLDTSNNSDIEVGSFQTIGHTVSMNLSVRARPEKRRLVAGDNYGLDAILQIVNPLSGVTVTTAIFALDSTGFKQFNDVALPESSGLTAWLKGRSHLAKKITQVNLSAGDVVLNFTDASDGNFGPYRLRAGDVQGSWPGIKDNLVDVLDLSALSRYFNGASADGDLNKDGVVDILDVSIALNNIFVSGDELQNF